MAFSDFVFCYECGHSVRQDKVDFHCYLQSCGRKESFDQLRDRRRLRRPGDLLRVRCPEDDIPMRPVCPRGHDMSLSYIVPDNVHLAFIGPRFCGKSTFFTALYHHLMSLGLTVTIWPQAKQQWFLDHWYRPYMEGKEIPKTTRATAFCMEVHQQKGFSDRRLFFTFYDAPGDWFWDAEELMSQAQYLLGATGVVFLFDPYSIPGLRNRQAQDGRLLPDIDPMLEQEIGRYNVTAALTSLVEFHRRAGQAVRRKSPVRLAVVMNKADLLMRDDLFAPAAVLDDCLEDVNDDRKRLRRVNHLTRELFSQLDSELQAEALDAVPPPDSSSLTAALQMAERHFSSVGCFVSISRPDAGEPAPRGVVNPLMWALGTPPTWLHALLGLVA